TYTPNQDFNGADSFSYTVTDGAGGTDTATVTLSVGADNDAPVAGDDAFSTAEDVARLITAAELLANDTDVDGDTLTIASFTQAAHGTVVDHLDGTYTYTPNQDFNGADSFSYTVTDGAGGTDTATVTLSVGADNDAPVLDLIADQGVLVNQLLSIQASATDPDGPGDTLTFSLVGTVPTGAAITTDGLFTWTPTPTAYGTTPITVRVTDSGTPGLFDEDTFDVTVIAPPRVAIDDVLLVEPDDGQTALAVFRVMLSGPAPVGVSVSYANIATFNATPGVDFVAGSGTLTFDPGETEKTFSITVLGDASIEGDERFAYDIFSPVNAVLSGKQQGFADILDDDGETRVGIERRTAMEGDSGTTTAVFDVLLSSPSASTVTVDYATVAFQATAGVDYVAASGTLTFAPGETAKTVSVEIIGDTITDGDERFTVLLTNPTNATISGLSQDLNAFIVDDDGPGLMVATSIGSGDSGGDMPDAAQLEATLDAAVTLWTQALGADDPRLAQLAGLTIGVADFSGAALGSLDGGAILIDADAAGHGWFVDLTPAGNSEYRLSADAGMLSATPRSDAFGRMDLLTVVLHEIGHVLGFDHEDAASYAVMRDELSAGVRYTTAAPKFDLDAPWAGARKAAIAWDDWGSGWAPAHKPRVAHLGRTFADFLFSR
ncbi:MAG: tandem-95 repeat protein, partial [Betaproteobacteria bacterium]|nr:tandem-95 repeat protein [Betaproteobacteria bacterium]